MEMYLVMDDSSMIKYLRVVTSYLISNINPILTSPREYIIASIPRIERNPLDRGNVLSYGWLIDDKIFKSSDIVLNLEYYSYSHVT